MSVHATVVAGTGAEVPCQADGVTRGQRLQCAQFPFGQPQGLVRNRPEQAELAVLCLPEREMHF
jgi:hypothetical protein